MRGRKRQPEAIRDAKAPVRSKRAKPAAPKLQPMTLGEIVPPKFRDVEATKIWNALAPQLVTLKLLTPLDVPAFSRYCRLAGRWEQAEKELDRDGLTYESVSAHGRLKRAHPSATLSVRFSRELANLEASYGLTPADRQRIFAERARGSNAPTGGLFDKPAEDAPTDAADAEEQPPAAPPANPIGLLN